MSVIHHVVMRPIVITSANRAIRVTYLATTYTANVAVGTYWTTTALASTSIVRGVRNALNAVLPITVTAAPLAYHRVPPTYSYRYTHSGGTPVDIRGDLSATTFPLVAIGLAPGVSTEILPGGSGIAPRFSSPYAWVSPQPAYTLDEAPPIVSIAEMDTPGGQVFRVQHSDVKRFRTLRERAIPRAQMVRTTSTPEDSLEELWTASLLERVRLYRALRTTADEMSLSTLQGTYTWTGEALTTFAHRRTPGSRVPIYDVDLPMRLVV